MYRQVITYLALSAALTNLLYAQSVIPLKEPSVKKNPASVPVKSLYEISRDVKNEIPNVSKVDFSIRPPEIKAEEKGFQSLVSSFRNNIRFGGFWERYAIINFSPSVFVKPFDFISIYGNQNTCYLIPLEGIKQEMKSLCIRGAAILAVDNACRFLLGSNELVPAIANFTLKSVVLQLLKSTQTNEVIHENSFYYAVSIRF